MGPLGKHDKDSGAAVHVGEAVHGDVLAGIDGAVNEFKELPSAAGMSDALVEVGEVTGEAGPPADIEGFLDGVEEPIAEGVAEVGVVDAAESGGFLGETDEFVGGGVAAGRVVEAGRHAKGALFHAFTEHGPHVGDVGVGGGGIVPAHGADADRGVADDIGDVDGDLVVEHGEVLGDGGPGVGEGWGAVEAGVELDEVPEVIVGGEGGVGVAVDAYEFGGDALADLGVVLGLGEDDEAGVGVHVDEAGADDFARGIDGVVGGGVGVVAAEDADLVTLDADCGVEAWVAGAVDDEAVLDEGIEHGGNSLSTVVTVNSRSSAELQYPGPGPGRGGHQ